MYTRLTVCHRSSGNALSSVTFEICRYSSSFYSHHAFFVTHQLEIIFIYSSMLIQRRDPALAPYSTVIRSKLYKRLFIVRSAKRCRHCILGSMPSVYLRQLRKYVSRKADRTHIKPIIQQRHLFADQTINNLHL